jgi:hypothetical protein
VQPCVTRWTVGGWLYIPSERETRASRFSRCQLPKLKRPYSLPSGRARANTEQSLPKLLHPGSHHPDRRTLLPVGGGQKEPTEEYASHRIVLFTLPPISSCTVQINKEIGGNFRDDPDFFYIYFIVILQKYMIRHKFCKNIHLPCWLTASGT